MIVAPIILLIARIMAIMVILIRVTMVFMVMKIILAIFHSVPRLMEVCACFIRLAETEAWTQTTKSCYKANLDTGRDPKHAKQRQSHGSMTTSKQQQQQQ